jgi:L-iditol 2-dehydrogenase
MSENRAAVLHAPGDVRVADRPVPEPGPLDVLVEIAAVGVCGSDVHYYEHGRIGSHVVEAPMVLGHEPSGIVTQVGSEVTRHRVGDRVTLEPGVPDLVCEQCRAGRYNLCPNVRFFATPPIDGAFARFVTIHEAFAYALPEELTLEQGALMEPLSVGVWACRKGGVGPGSRVLVSGAGPIGNLAAQVALAAGAAEVVVTDISAHRLDVATRVGATRVLDVSSSPLAESGIEVDVLLECSGHPAALADGIRALAPAGSAVVVGMGPEEDATIPLALIQNRELWLTGTFRYANTYPTAIALAAQGRVDLDIIMTGRYGLDEAEAALRAPREDPLAIKPMVFPGG